MKKIIKIACLPLAGIENPYQHLMINGLNQHQNISAFNGVKGKFFGILITALKQKPDYIHFDWINSYYSRRELWMTLINLPSFLLQIILVRFLKIKIAWTLHNIEPHDVKYKKLHRFLRRFFARRCDFVRVFSEHSIHRAIEYLNIPRDKFKVIPEGSYIGYYKDTINRVQARKLFNIQEKSKVLLYLGLIKPYKGIEDLVTTFNELNLPDSKLIIAGKVMDGKYFNAVLKPIIKDNTLLFDQFIEKDDLQNFYYASDFVVLPFKKIENSGSAILAMGFKKPIICPQKGVLINRLNDQKELLYLDDALAEKIKIAVNLDSERVTQIGENNYKNLAKYKWDDYAKYFISTQYED